MTKNQLVKEICRREGKKSQVAIGNVREIISILEDMFQEDIFSEGGETVSQELGALGAINLGAQRKLTARWKKFNKAAK